MPATPATSKVSPPGGLFQAPGCAPYSLAASDGGSNGMGTEEHAAAIDGAVSTGIETVGRDGYALGFQEIDETQVPVVGGKGAHLGELSRIEGIRVPPGFCVTTDAFGRAMAQAPSIADRLDRLSSLNPDDGDAIRTVSAEIRRTVEGIGMPDDVAGAVAPALRWVVPPRRVTRRARATAAG